MSLNKCIYIGPYVECSHIGMTCPNYGDAIGDSLFRLNPEVPKGESVLLASNESRGEDPRPDFDDDDEFSLDICPDGIQAEKDWLAESFADELQKLTSIFSVVTIRWGVFQYFM